jgi:hypothetical protein
MLWDILEGKWDTKAFQKAIFIREPTVAQWIHIQRLSPENKGVSPYITLQASYRSKKQGLTLTWLHATLLATSPQGYVTFYTFRFFKFYLPAVLSPPPATLSEYRLACFFSGSPSCCTYCHEQCPVEQFSSSSGSAPEENMDYST